MIRIDHTRIDKYNAAGILLDGATGDTLPLTASRRHQPGHPRPEPDRRPHAVRQLRGQRQLLQPADRHQRPALRPGRRARDRGLDGQRSSTRCSRRTSSRAPARRRAARRPATRTCNQAAGLRLIGAGPSQLQRSNIVDNSYGVFNAQLDGATANTAVPVRAENNWWGLRAATRPTNTGPAISPTTNPPVPENPVNGAACRRPARLGRGRLRAVPRRPAVGPDHAASSPSTTRPGPVNDTAPTVGVCDRQGDLPPR